MDSRARAGLVWIAAFALLSACAAPKPEGTNPQGVQAQTPAATKRITAAIRSDPASLVQQRTTRSIGSLRGLDAVEELTDAGLTMIGGDGNVVAQLAESVPTTENQQWMVFPDGRMETTWTIKPGVVWQDGVPLTSDDLAFTATVEQDSDLDIPAYPAYAAVDRIETPDPRTIKVTWKRPFIEANRLFSYRVAGLPLPRHLLEKAYTEDKENFLGNAYWADAHVGVGAYKVQQWVADSNVVLTANDNYVFGRPKIDEIDVRFIPDPSTLLANVLAGIDMTLGKTISYDQARQVGDQWAEGQVLTKAQNWTPISVQFVDPDPAVVLQYPFRKAMIEAIDRQQLVDSMWAGQSQVGQGYVLPDTPNYSTLIEPSVVKYQYDPRDAARLIQSLSYTKRADGFYYDTSGQKLSVTIYTTVQNDIHPKATAAVSDYWRQLGVDVDQVMIPVQRARDREYRAQFPTFELVETGNSLRSEDVARFHSSRAPLPENHFSRTGNNSRYQNPELDALIDKYVSTVPLTDRMQALAEIVHHQTANLTQLVLFYGLDPTLVSNRITNVQARGDQWTQAWNVQDWDIKS